jgi:hypothetical protein
MDIYEDNSYQKYIKSESYDDYGNYKIIIDITQIPLEKLNSLSYQEPYGRHSLFFMLSNNINENINENIN